MTNFLGDLGKKIGETAETMISMAGDSVEVQKLKGQIRNLERGNSHDMEDLGRAVYQQFLDSGKVDESAQELCEAIRSRESDIAECVEKISQIKGEQKCPVCGKVVARGMAFCPYCGTQMPEIVVEECEEDCDCDTCANEDEVQDKVDDLAQAAEDVAAKAEEMASSAVDEVTDKVGEAADKIL